MRVQQGGGMASPQSERWFVDHVTEGIHQGRVDRHHLLEVPERRNLLTMALQR